MRIGRGSYRNDPEFSIELIKIWKATKICRVAKTCGVE